VVGVVSGMVGSSFFYNCENFVRAHDGGGEMRGGKGGPSVPVGEEREGGFLLVMYYSGPWTPPRLPARRGART
jgi:hypothetical protein